MPTYDYECAACGHTFELFQKMSDAVKRKCPECSKSKLKRLIGSGAAIVFKGSGFYQTDYRSAEYKKSAEKERKAAESGSGDKKSSDAASGSSSDSSSKPAPKSAKDSKPKGDK